MSPTVRRRVLVAGRVQGVGFRVSCARRARRAGVAGWVRNLPDGRVEAAFEGEAAVVEELVAWCAHGPGMATVDTVAAHDEPLRGAASFDVR